MTSAIAVAVVSIMESRSRSGGGPLPVLEYRYTMWKKRHQTGELVDGVTKMRSFLCYQGKTIEEVMSDANFMFNMRKMRVMPGLEKDDEGLGILVKAQISEICGFKVFDLGVLNDIRCYAVIPERDSEENKGWFGIHAMPGDWIADVAYMPGTVRESFGSVSITNATHGGDPRTEREFFEYIDSKARSHLPAKVL